MLSCGDKFIKISTISQSEKTNELRMRSLRVLFYNIPATIEIRARDTLPKGLLLVEIRLFEITTLCIRV